MNRETNHKLQKIATDIYNYLFIGLLFMLIGDIVVIGQIVMVMIILMVRLQTSHLQPLWKKDESNPPQAILVIFVEGYSKLAASYCNQLGLATFR